MCSHLRQPDNTEKFMKRLEKGVSMVQQLNLLRSKSVLDEDVQNGSAIVINYAQLPGRGAYKRPRKQLKASSQHP